MLNDRKYFDDDNKKKKFQIELNFTGLEQLALKEFLLNQVKGIFIKLGQASF